MQQAVLGAFVVAVVALTGCGANKASDEPNSTERVCKYGETTLLRAMEAAVPDDATVRVSATVAVAGASLVMDGRLAYTADGLDADLTIDGPDGTFSYVLLGKRVFYADGDRSGEYRELNASDPGFAQARGLAEGADIAGEFDAWKAGLEKVEQMGEESIDGERACHYALTVNAADASAADGESVPGDAPKTIRYEVFLTADDLIRRVTFNLQGYRSEMNAIWDDPVDITVPKRLKPSS